MNADASEHPRTEPSWLGFWGKAGHGQATHHRLAYHCLDVAAVGAALAAARPRWIDAFARSAGTDRTCAERVLPFLLCLHDIGKFGDGFQRLRQDVAFQLGRQPANVSNDPRHDTLGFLLWQELADPASITATPALSLDVIVGSTGERLAPRRAFRALEPWMAAITGHHGRPPEVRDGRLMDHFGIGHRAGAWLAAAEFAEDVRQLLDPPPLSLATALLQSPGLRPSSWWLAGFVVLCDWIGSNQNWFPFEPASVPLNVYWHRAIEQAETAIRSAGFEPRRARPFGGLRELFPDISTPTPLQCAAASIPFDDGPQLFLLEDLTGSGKTEAALIVVARLLADARSDGLYFALPTMATANAMHARVASVIARLFECTPPASFVLAHSGPRLTGSDSGLSAGGLDEHRDASLSQEDDASTTARGWLLDSRKKALLADIGVGTIDQALVAALRSRHNALRLLGLHGHVLVVDEVHACDEYMNGLLQELLRMHAALGGSAVLLSATLPLSARERLIGAFRSGLGADGHHLTDVSYPSLCRATRTAVEARPIAPRPESCRTVAIEFVDSADGAIDLCLRQASLGRCVAWIRNTVRDALEAYDSLRLRLDPNAVQLFHARFPLADRLRIEDEVLARFGRHGVASQRAGRIVVATQVLEQSLDVDFDDIVTDLAPIDRVIQRCGRLQRHQRGDRGRPVAHVVAPEWSETPAAGWPGKIFRGTVAVYQRPSTLWRTQQVLRQERQLELPGRARALVEAVFGPDDSSIPAAIGQADREVAAEAAELTGRAMACFNRVSLENGFLRIGAEWSDDEHAPTRLGESSTIIRLMKSDGERIKPWCDDEDVPATVQWQLGDASVRASQVVRARDETLRARLCSQGVDVPEHVVPIAMVPSGVVWTGGALGLADGVEQPVTVLFEHRRGLSFDRNTEV